MLVCSHSHFPRHRTKTKNYLFSLLLKVIGGKVKKPGKRGRKPAKIDLKAKLERSRQSARECRARKKLRYQYLEELVSSRERAICALREELEMVRKSVNKCMKKINLSFTVKALKHEETSSHLLIHLTDMGKHLYWSFRMWANKHFHTRLIGVECTWLFHWRSIYDRKIMENNPNIQ